MRIGGHEIKVSNADRVMFPDSGITKGEVVEHYARVAKVMLPHLRGRPVSMQRVRENIGVQVFYQKDTPEYFPDWIRRVMKVPVPVNGSRMCTPLSPRDALNSDFRRCWTLWMMKSTTSIGV